VNSDVRRLRVVESTAVNDTENLGSPEGLEAILAETERLGFAMASEPRTGSLLRTLVQAKPGGVILELGTGTGVATAWLLGGMDAHSRLLTVEQDRVLASVARAHLGDDPRVTFCVEDADVVLARIADERFDLIFADTWAGKYTHLDEALGLLKEGGLYVIDDMLPQANWPDGHEEKVRELIAVLEARQDLAVTKMNWASGIIVAAKRDAWPGAASN
jgi:predicted O-methyltransferase YrrM